MPSDGDIGASMSVPREHVSQLLTNQVTYEINESLQRRLAKSPYQSNGRMRYPRRRGRKTLAMRDMVSQSLR